MAEQKKNLSSFIQEIKEIIEFILKRRIRISLIEMIIFLFHIKYVINYHLLELLIILIFILKITVLQMLKVSILP